MFETMEIGRSIKRKHYEEAVLKLREELLLAQFELEKRPYSVIVIVSGVEGAGKGTVVHRLNEWMDPRGIETNAFWDTSDEERERPFFWRFWRAMPANGKIGVFFGSWYTQPIVQSVLEGATTAEFDAEMQRIADFEHMLRNDGTLIVKLWFHLSEEAMRRQLDGEAPRKEQNLRIPEEISKNANRYQDFVRISERAIRQTDSDHSPWHLIEAENGLYRDLTAGETLLRAMQEHLARDPQPFPSHLDSSPLAPTRPTILDTVPKDLVLEPDDYKKQLRYYQAQLQDLVWESRRRKLATVAVFEGWDAAGKGSAIRRVTQAIDPRLFSLVQFAAPTDEESAHHYLWRFWRKIARDGRATIFDRSWYGRVLVERVEQYAHPEEWQRAYSEINRFEEQLSDHGSVVMKFWIHISMDKQLERFEERQKIAYKQHKITDEDWRNRDKWDEYEAAVHDMVTHTSTAYAPWTLVAGNDKRYARVQILKTFCERIERALANHNGRGSGGSLAG